MTKDRSIDFIIIGAQKAGTTALFDHLSDDPSLSLSRVKEVHFFDDDARDWSKPDYDAYHAQFDWSQKKLRGEATPIYIYWPNALERIAAYSPDIKLILMLRDPVERAWSHWRMEYSRGVEALSFADSIRRGRQRLFHNEPWGHDREFSYVERGFYADQIERLFSLFSREQVLILRAEDLQLDPDTVLSKFNAFVGAAPPPKTAARRVHVGQDMGAMNQVDRDYLGRVYAADAARLPLLVGRPDAS